MKKKVLRKEFLRKLLVFIIIITMLVNVTNLIRESLLSNGVRNGAKDDEEKDLVVDGDTSVVKSNLDVQQLEMLDQDLLINYEIAEASKLYLNEKYLRVVKLAYMDSDSKMIVDRATKKPLEQVLHALNELNINNLVDIKNFVDIYMHEPGIEIIKANLTDWNQVPRFVQRLENAELKKFSLALNRIWLDLHKKFDLSKLDNGCVSSHLPMKHPFIVPGGRFLEIYYWDTFWTMEGLLVCGMFDTARQMLNNFVYFIKQFGFIPNGSRIYYLNRSQPPYFAQMVQMFYDVSMQSTELTLQKKLEIRKFVLNRALSSMIKEYEYWMANKTVEITTSDGQLHTYNIYRADTNRPRPESYFEDINTARYCKRNEERSQLYMDISTAAETGYDFSSRWFNDSMNMCTIQTTDIIPVDLNAIMFKTELIIARFCEIKGDLECAQTFKNNALLREQAINALFWNEPHSRWSDYNHKTQELNVNFYLSDLMPLFMGIRAPNRLEYLDIVNKHINYFDKYLGGIPVSAIKSSQQWDFPNAWAPNHHTMVTSLLEYDRNLALKYAKKFFNAVYEGWKRTNSIFEKYDVLVPGERGSGGEYEVQSGFGWTNGVTLSFINTFRDDLLD